MGLNLLVWSSVCAAAGLYLVYWKLPSSGRSSGGGAGGSRGWGDWPRPNEGRRENLRPEMEWIKGLTGGSKIRLRWSFLFPTHVRLCRCWGHWLHCGFWPERTALASSTGPLYCSPTASGHCCGLQRWTIKKKHLNKITWAGPVDPDL